MMRMRRELAGNEPQITPQIDNLVLVDRSVDLLTPLATQLTYEGLIDEIFCIRNSEFYRATLLFALLYIKLLEIIQPIISQHPSGYRRKNS